MKNKSEVKIGRLNRRMFALYYLAAMILVLGCIYVEANPEILAFSNGFAALFAILFFPLIAVLIIVEYLLMAARFHDLGKSGWFSLLGILLNGILALFLMFAPGEKKKNKYGSATK